MDNIKPTCTAHQLGGIKLSQNKVPTIRTNIRPVIIQNIIWSAGVWLFREIPECHKVPSKKSYAVFLKAAALSIGYMSICGRRSHKKKTMTSSTYHEAKEFSLSVQDQGGADQANWTLCLCAHGPRTFRSSWIFLKAYRPVSQTHSWSSLPPPHVARLAP